MRQIFGIALTLAFLSVRANGDDLVVHRVGDLGDVKRIEFRGVEEIPVDEIRDALSNDFDYQFAAHPLGPRHQLLSSLQDLIERGYRQSGFVEPNVKATLDPAGERIVVSVEEGARIRAGKIRVVGEPQIDVAKLVQSLTAPTKGRCLRKIVEETTKEREAGQIHGKDQSTEETEKPVWQPGKPVSFEADATNRRLQRIEDALMDLGCVHGKVSAELETPPGSDVADLVVSIDDQGRRLVIDEIDVKGLEKNSRVAFDEFLGVREGEILTRELWHRLDERLYESARFWKYRVVPEALDTEMIRFRLAIEVVEYPPASPLDADFSPEQRLLLTLRKQLENLAESGDELVLHAEGDLFDGGEVGLLKSVTGVVSPARGVLITANGTWDSQRPAKYAVVLAPDETGLYSGGRGEKYRAQVFWQTVIVGASITPGDTDDAGKFQSNVNFHTSVNSDKEEASVGPVRFRLRLAPVAMLREGLRGDTKVTTNDGVTKFEREGQWIALDAETGRLIEWVLVDSKTGSKLRASLARGEFEKRYAAWQTELAPALNYHHPQAPFGSLAAFLNDEWIWARGGPPSTASTAQTRIELLTRLLDETLVASLRKATSTGGEDNKGTDDEKFKIPSQWKPGGAPPNQVQAFILIGARVLPGAAEALFPRRSWPWTLARETAFFVHGKRTHTGSEMGNLLVSDEIGPLGCLAIGRVLAFAHADGARLFATKGKVGELTTAEFRKDTRLLTQGDALLARATRRMADILRDAGPAEIDAVAEILPAEVASWLRQSATALRLGADQAAEDILRDSLDDLWLGVLKDWTRRELDKLSQLGVESP